MTISSTTRIAGPFTGNGVTTVFPFTFKVFANIDLRVAKLNTASNIETILVLNTDYTVTLNGDQDSNPGGTITASVLAVGFSLTITSDVANLQPTDLTNQGGFYPEVITDALDRATIQIQQLADQTDRAIKIPLSDGVLDMTTPVVSARQGKYLAFDSLGLPIASVGTGNDSALRTDLANASASSAGSRLSGFRQTGTGAVARTVDDKLKETISVKDFGATGDGSTDDTAAIALAIAATPTNGLLIFPSPGTYKTTSTTLIQKNISIQMQGTSAINYVTAANTPAMLFDYSMNNVSLELSVSRATRNWSVGADGIVFYDIIDSDVKIRATNRHYRGLALQAQRAYNLNATYNRVGETVTITKVGHGLSNGDGRYFTFTSGTITEANIFTATVLTPDTFTINSSATYSRVGTLVTITRSAHGLSTGNTRYFDFTSGGITEDNTFSVTVLTANTFTITTVGTGINSGNVSYSVGTGTTSGNCTYAFTSGSISYMTWHLGKMWDNKYGLHCETVVASFVNDNIFYGGRFSLTFGAANLTEDMFYTYHKNAGSSVHYSPSFEANGNASFKTIMVYYDTGCKQNQIVQPYMEKDQYATIMRVGGSSFYNIIRGLVSSSVAESLDTQVEELAGLENPGTNIIDWNGQANVSLFRGGLQEIFPITDVYSNTVYVAGDNYIVPGFTFVSRNGASPGVFSMFYNSSSNCYLSNNFLSISDSALGKFVDTTIVKNFWMSVDKVVGFGGTPIIFVVKAYDSNNAIITTVGEVRGNVTNLDDALNFSYNASVGNNYGDSYTVVSSVDSKCFFNVSSNVKKIWVGVAPSPANFIGISSISLKCNADYPPPLSYPAYSNVNPTYIDLDDEIVSTSIPLGGIIRDAKVWKIVQTTGTSQGWWKTRNFKTITTATTAAAGTVISATAVTGIVVGDIIGVETIRASDSSIKWHWSTVTVIATLDLTIAAAIPAGYSVAVGADVLTYKMLAMPNNA